MALNPKNIATIKDALKSHKRSLNVMLERNRENQLLKETYQTLLQEAADAEKAL